MRYTATVVNNPNSRKLATTHGSEKSKSTREGAFAGDDAFVRFMFCVYYNYDFFFQYNKAHYK